MVKMLLPPDFKDFLKLLNLHNVEYLIIGGYAVAYHGYPRATGDLDIWIGTSIENSERLIRVLQEFGIEISDTQQEFFLQPNKVFRMGKPPIRIELLTGISGVNFPECYSNCIRTTLDDVPVNIIEKKDLIKNKKNSGRPRDIDDLLYLDDQKEQIN